MAYRLNSDLTYCLIDGHPIFLDISRDRYFRLSPALEYAFLEYASTGQDTGAKVKGLAARGILCDADPHGDHPEPVTAKEPQRSAMESARSLTRVGPRITLEVLALAATTSLQLRREPLMQNIQSMERYRQRHAGGALPRHTRGALESEFCSHTLAFQRARLYAPINMRCLPDSISLVRYLARRGLHAHLVFGVMANPLSAHCWVQAGDLVLNDTVGNVRAHTPIRVV